MNKIRWVPLAIFAVLLSSLPVAVYAGMYVSGAMSLNDHGFEVDGDALGYTMAVGYRPQRSGFGAQLGYSNTGSASVSGLGNLKMTGANLSAVYWIPNNEPRLAYMHGYVKLGIYNMTATVGSATEYSKGYSAGMGFEFKVKPYLGIYTDLDGFALVDATDGRDDMLSIWSIGARYHF
jgi:hypothetical protein